MTCEELSLILKGEGTEETYRDAVCRYPYFAPLMLAGLRRAGESDERKGELRRRLATLVGDRDTLAVILGEEPEEFVAFYPDERKADLTTEATIESFLDKFGGGPEREVESTGVVPVAAPSVDYAVLLEQSGDEVGESGVSDSTSEMLESYFGGNREEEGKREVETPALTESLARIMIKNHNYGKALEIIEALSLNNPGKSIYFADQIRFLRKLIKINASK